MKSIEIDKNFEDYFLVVGNTYDNFLFENCPIEVLDIAKEKLSNSANETKSIVIDIDKRIEKLLENSMESFDNIIQHRIICRDYINSLIMRELIKIKPLNRHSEKDLDKVISAIISGNKEDIIDTLSDSPFAYEIDNHARKIGKIELTFLLRGIDNKILQGAINNYISSRTPYSIKVFSSREKLASYVDEQGSLIESPHDYMARDINKFITFKENEII